MVIQLYTFYYLYPVNILIFQQNLVFQPVPSQMFFFPVHILIIYRIVNIFTILSLIPIFIIRNQEFILKGGNNVIDYSPLWVTMEKRNISQYYLVNNGIDYRTMQQLRNNQNITASTIEKLCRILSCTPNDILTFTDDDTHDK